MAITVLLVVLAERAPPQADIAQTGMPQTKMLATKIETDEFELDKSKMEMDIAIIAEHNRKVKNKESRLYFEKLDQQQQRSRNALAATQSLF